MPIGLLHCTAACSHRAESAAGRVGPQFARLQIGLLVDLPGLEIEEFFVTRVLQHQGFLAVADDDPVPLADFELLHATNLWARWARFPVDCFRGANATEAIQLPTESSRRAMTCAWISAAPSKMLRMRASHRMRETGNSSAKPLPPWICTALSALAQATRAAKSLAMPASRSQRLPESFCRAAK